MRPAPAVPHAAPRLAWLLALLALALALWAPALFSRTSRDHPQLLGLYSLGYGALLAVYLVAVLGLAGAARAARRPAGWVRTLERSLAATTQSPWLAGGLALAATVLTGALALGLPGWLSDYGVQHRSWVAWGLAVAYLPPLWLWGVPALTYTAHWLAVGQFTCWAVAAIIVGLVGLRLVNLNALPLDVDSSRQPFTLDVALFLCRHPEAPTHISITQSYRGPVADLKILQRGDYPHPEVFPVYSWLVGRLFCAFGPATSLARLLSLAGWAIGCVGLHGYARRWHGPAFARWALLIYAAMPLGLYFSRVALRQSLDLGLSLMGLYAVSEWAARPTSGRLWLLAGALLVGVAVASYPPLGVCGVVVLALAVHKFGWRFLLKPELWLALLVAGLPLVSWYWLASDNGSVLTLDGRDVTQLAYFFQWLSPAFVRLVPATIIDYLILPGGLGLLVFGLGALRAPRSPLRWAALWAAAGVACLALADPGAAFANPLGYQHLYIYLILGPPLALLLAAGLPPLADWLRTRGPTAPAGVLALTVTAAILVPGLFFLRPMYATPAHAAEMAQALHDTLQPDETYLLLTGDTGIGYLAGRRGVAYDVLRGPQALPDAAFQALLCAAPTVTAVMDPVEMEAVAPDQFAFLKQHYPVLVADRPGWIFDTRTPAGPCPPAGSP